MNVSVSVVSDKSISLAKMLAKGKGGKSVRIKALRGGSYLLAESEGGYAPENITVKRVGKNLHVALEGTDPDQPELIIEEFFNNQGELVGLGEDGAYHAYIAVDGDSDSGAALLMDGVSSPLALGSSQLAGFGEGLAIAGSGMLPWMLAGLAGLVGGAIIDHNKGGGKVADTHVPDNKGIGSVIDDQGPSKGNIANGGLTDDARPTLGGSGQAPGDKVTIFDNGRVVGEAIVDDKGNWTFTPDIDLGDGKHSFEVVITNPAGNSSKPSPEYVIVIDTTPPTNWGIDDVIDDQGAITGPVNNGGRTDDRQPTLSGKGDPGNTITIIDNGTIIGEAQVGEGGTWTFTPETELVEGDHSFQTIVTDPAGNSSGPSDEFLVIIDLTPPGVGDAELTDDVGAITGTIVDGMTTDDNTPSFTGKTEADATVVIYDGGKEIGKVKADGEGNWSFTPSPALNDGEHVFNYEVIAGALGGSGLPRPRSKALDASPILPAASLACAVSVC